MKSNAKARELARELKAAERELAKANRKSDAKAEARRRLGPGSSRARVTTANAKWAQAAEARDRVAAKVTELRAQLAQLEATEKLEVEKKAARKKAAHACGSLKASVCLIEALLAGKPVEVAQVRKSWVVREPGAARPIVRRMTEANAREAIEAAREVVTLGSRTCAPPAPCPAPEPCPPCDRPLTPAELGERRRARVVTPQRPRGEAATYQVIEAAQLVPSHDPHSFAPDARYPANVQEREYHRDQGEQMKVRLGAQNVDPSFLLTNTPTAMDGPPLVTAGPPFLALGGNGRSMMIKRAYDEGAPGERYRSALLERSIDFGITADEVRGLERPVLVRVLEDLKASTPARELAAAVRRYNEGLTQQLSPRARAVSEARTLRPATIAALGDVLGSVGDGQSLRDVMRERPAELLAILERDGVVTAQNRAQWVNGANLSDEGKDRLEGLFLGRVVGTGDRLNATAPGLLRKVERAVPFLVRVASINEKLDLIPQVQAALDLLNAAASHSMTLAQLLAQGSLFGGKSQAFDTSPEVLRIAGVLQDATPRKVAEHFASWSARAAHDPRQPSMFWTPPSRTEALAALEARVPNPGACCASCAAGGPCAGSRTKNPGGLKVVLRFVGRKQGADLYAACLASVNEAGKVTSIFSCSDVAPSSFDAALTKARRLAKSQGLELDPEGAILLESDLSRPRPLFAFHETKARTSDALARELLGLGDLARKTLVVHGPSGVFRFEFDKEGAPVSAHVNERPWPALLRALTKDFAALGAGGNAP